MTEEQASKLVNETDAALNAATTTLHYAEQAVLRAREGVAAAGKAREIVRVLVQTAAADGWLELERRDHDGWLELVRAARAARRGDR